MKPHEKLKKRVPLGGGPLGDSPFAVLGAPAPKAPDKVPEAVSPKPSRDAFHVVKSRKGNWPVAIERRGGGKVVTLLRNVEGDAGALLAALRRHCGAGGALREEGIESQGDQRGKITAFLERQKNP